MTRPADDDTLLQRYLDGELGAFELDLLRERLAKSRELRAELRALRAVGASLRVWSAGVRARAPDLTASTLAQLERKRRSRRALMVSSLGGGTLALLLGWSSLGGRIVGSSGEAEPNVSAPAAILQLDSGERQAQVFLVGATPVVWLADDEDGDAPGPG